MLALSDRGTTGIIPPFGGPVMMLLLIITALMPTLTECSKGTRHGPQPLICTTNLDKMIIPFDKRDN